MTPDAVVSLARDAGLMALTVAGPILLAGLVTGLAVSLLQAVTQLQDSTLTFIPKIIATLVVLAALGHWMLGQLLSFTTALLMNLHVYAR